MTTPPSKKMRLTVEERGDPTVQEHTEELTVSDHCYLTSLPSEVLVAILSFLSARDKLCVRLTCHRLYSFLTDSLFWKSICWKDYFPPREGKAMKCALKFGIISLTKLSIFSCSSFKLNGILACTRLQSIILIGFAISQRQIAALLSSTSASNLEVQIEAWESKQIFKILAPSKLSSVVLCVSDNPNIIELTEVWSQAGYSPPDVNIRVRYDSNITLARTHSSLLHVLSSLPPCGHKARLAVGYSSIHTYFRQATTQLFCEISNQDFGFEVRQLDCEKLGLSTYGFLLTRPNVATDTCTAAYVNKLYQPLMNKRTLQDISLIESITELCLAGLKEFSSHHLMLIALNCPNLIRINIEQCTRSLSDLSGLASIASHCQKLQGINFDRIHHCAVENIVKLWEVLAQLKHLSHLRFCYCLVSTCRTVSQRHVASSVAPSVQSRVSHSIPQIPDMELVRCFIGKLTSVDTLELTCHVPSIQDDTVTFQTLSHFKSVQSLHLEGCPQKIDILNLIFVALRLSRIVINSNSLHSVSLPSIASCYQNLRKIAIIAQRDLKNIVIDNNIASAMTSARKLTHVFIAASFESLESITVLINESPFLMDFFLTGKIQDSLSFKTRSSVKKLEKSLNTKLKEKLVRHHVALYINPGTTNALQEMKKAVYFSEFSSLWMSPRL